MNNPAEMCNVLMEYFIKVVSIIENEIHIRDNESKDDANMINYEDHDIVKRITIISLILLIQSFNCFSVTGKEFIIHRKIWIRKGHWVW